MRRWSVIVAVMLAAATFGSRAEAQNYPWCAVYGGDMDGARNCGFTTRDQCTVTVSGIGGFCEPNNLYVPPGTAGRNTRLKHKPQKPS
jgi:hypothetical protein